MKILYCIPNLAHGGAERQASYMAAELARRGHDVHIAGRSGGPNLQRALSAGVVWHCLGERGRRGGSMFGPIRAFTTLLKLIILIRKIRPDVVQTILAPMDILGGAAALITRRPWVLKECSSAIIYTAYRRYWLRFAFGRLAHKVISNSRHANEYWRQAHADHRLHVIPNAIPMSEIAKANSYQGEISLNPDDRLILYAGRVDIGKNVEALISALGQLKGEIPFKAIICGEGSTRAEVERMVRELGLADRILFTSYVDNLWELMKRADAFVSFSRCEGCPNVVLEAMACGCPLIVSDIPAHRELLDDGDALFVRLDESAEAVKAIRAVLTDAAAARARADSSKAKIAQRASLKDTALRYESAYVSVIQARTSQKRGRNSVPFVRGQMETANRQGEM